VQASFHTMVRGSAIGLVRLRVRIAAGAGRLAEPVARGANSDFALRTEGDGLVTGSVARPAPAIASA
jgi:hypothetical protein